MALRDRLGLTVRLPDEVLLNAALVPLLEVVRLRLEDTVGALVLLGLTPRPLLCVAVALLAPLLLPVRLTLLVTLPVTVAVEVPLQLRVELGRRLDVLDDEGAAVKEPVVEREGLQLGDTEKETEGRGVVEAVQLSVRLALLLPLPVRAAAARGSRRVAQGRQRRVVRSVGWRRRRHHR